MPPTRNTERQPKAGINAALTNPPTAAPTVKPQETHIMRVTRELLGLNSPTSAMAFGMMLPRPKPVMKRNTSKLSMVVTCVVSNMQAAKKKVEMISTGRRPRRSPTGVNTSEPSSMPNRPAPNTGPRLALLTPQSPMMAGAT